MKSGSTAAFNVPKLTYIGFYQQNFLLLSPVPICMVAWRARTVNLRRARTITSVLWVMLCTFFFALEISAACSMIKVSASSCVLTPVDGWTSFMLLFTCKRVTASTEIFRMHRKKEKKERKKNRMCLSQALVLIKDKSSWTKLSKKVASAVSPKRCKDIADAFTKTIESRCKKYEGCRVIFDNMDEKTLWRR